MEQQFKSLYDEQTRAWMFEQTFKGYPKRVMISSNRYPRDIWGIWEVSCDAHLQKYIKIVEEKELEYEFKIKSKELTNISKE